jgi:hypothetical protein
MREVGTTYWIKVWSYNNSKKMKEVFSEAIKRRALFNSQQMSRHLSESCKLGTGIRSEDDPEDDIDLPIEQPHRQVSVFLADCRNSLMDFSARPIYLKWTLSSLTIETNHGPRPSVNQHDEHTTSLIM